MNNNKTLIVIAGPTAVGKTAIAIQVAKHYNTVVLSADSRQFYREMSIGTAKPDADELAAIKHYFIDSHSIQENFSVGDFEKQALALLDELFKEYDAVVMAGGSGLYIKAVCEGFDNLPVADPGIRHRLNQDFTELGIRHLQERLKEVDPDYYEQVDIQNPQRLIRALEVYETTGKPISYYRKSTVNKRPFNIVKIGLNLPRDILYQQINYRVDKMMELGLIDEVKSLIPHRSLNALNTVGYSELFDYFDGNTDLESALELIKQNTRHFAKRQLTWFRKDKDIHWLEADDEDVVNDIVRQAELVIT
ncbi:tRNA (adenosine(37)-N6)-dimethylallyltransferase MiaA [Mucilaginibacter sp. E4BP6]|uniref:tRNA (adenosine(37)-N6)-dimethylallyltransferase MiaA n=1 Tax=Mucilaginibacter sp. E4BP6 TaxID=2723089 RepID=UPI0015CC19D9|nr:tRNA (adenosine(37)-N6)-dimethylallyltransferase MiaA [Mucilaginibacter sp. E4BP6]NYE67299.1 tRNA dimethylallyltransferase [Mucilaginibacter sp. E4BP6]